MAANPLTRLGAAALACSAIVGVATGWRSPLAVLLGMAGPLAVTAGSWMLLERAHVRDREHVSGMMIKLFGAKMVLVGLYVALAVLLLPAGRMVFVVSFVTHYILLHLMEALYLRRLFTVGHIDGQRLGAS